MLSGTAALAGSSVGASGLAARTCHPGAAAPGGMWIRAVQCHSLSPATRAEQDMLARVNDERAARHLPPLRWDTSLAASARQWSATMSVSGFRHSQITRLFAGRFDVVAENIAWASGSGVTAGVIHLNWMHSSGHRENILGNGLDAIGIGVYCAADGTMWATQNFGRFVTSGPPVALSPVAENPIARSDRGSATC
jgi:uncharacterized protein YkwD